MLTASLVGLLSVVLVAFPVRANHSWGTYHWARTSNPFTLNLGDNVDPSWDSYLSVSSSDWSQSTVLDTTIVTGNTRPKSCRPTSGMVEVCSESYGNTGWLGIAQIWLEKGTKGSVSDHITQGTVKVNDYYFSLPAYSLPAWRSLVMCQEIGHTFGLDHQDENSTNPNLGTCMDYTSDPSGNEHPNAHDYEQLETIYNGHLDSTTTVGTSGPSSAAGGNAPAEWGRVARTSADGRPSLYVRDLQGGGRLFTFVIWAR